MEGAVGDRGSREAVPDSAGGKRNNPGSAPPPRPRAVAENNVAIHRDELARRRRCESHTRKQWRPARSRVSHGSCDVSGEA